MPKRPQKKPAIKQETPEERKAKIVSRMQALEDLENKLGCIFMPMIRYTEIGSQTYINPVDAPKEDKTA